MSVRTPYGEQNTTNNKQENRLRFLVAELARLFCGGFTRPLVAQRSFSTSNSLPCLPREVCRLLPHRDGMRLLLSHQGQIPNLKIPDY